MKMLPYCVVLMLALLASFNSACTIKTCVNTGALPSEGETCFTATSNPYSESYQTCNDPFLICDTSFTQVCSTHKDATMLNYPGGACWNDWQCWSSQCSYSGYCVGSKQGSQCSRNENCDVGLYCKKDSCSPVKQLNEQCSSNAECRIDLVCSSGICINMYSIPSGQPSNEVSSDLNVFPTKHQSFACSSGWAYPNSEGSMICSSSAPHIVDKVSPFSCSSSNGVCQYAFSDSNATFNLSCQCGNDQNSGAFCPVVPSHEQNYIAIVKEFVKNTTHCSNAVKGNWHLCGDALRDSETWRDLITLHYEAYQWNLIANSLSCLKHTNQVVIYWWAKEKVNPVVDSGYILSGMVALFASLIFLI